MSGGRSIKYFESLADQRIREAMEAGSFENLPGAGRPIPGDDQPLEEMWWVRRKLRDEGLSFLPPTLEVRLLAEKTLDEIRRATDEVTVRQLIDTLNGRIRAAEGSAVPGPASTVGQFDPDDVVARWRDGRI